jgi:dihydrofolate synthase/folylpolyglutamate synthase
MIDPFDAILADYYQQIDALYSFITDPKGDRVFQEKSNVTRQREHGERLARTTDFLDFAGNPQDQYHTIHVAGTSGKGSVSAMFAAILTGAGQRTGFHISPYLQICNEKLILNGQMVSPQNFAQSVRRFMQIHADWVEADRAFNDLRYGEAWVSLTYLWFAWQQAEWVVMETGLGGRFDPTNLITPMLSVITNVNYDHLKSLGPDLLDIAYHKAGIIKPGRPVITAETNQDVLTVFQREADQKNAPLYRLGQDFDYSVESSSDHGAVISVAGPFRSYHSLTLPVPGAFQMSNAALVVASLDLLLERGELIFSGDPDQTMKAALANFAFPGRMEIIQQSPVVILDGAHNPHKVQALVKSVRGVYYKRKITAIVGMMQVKDAQSVIGLLAPLVSGLFLLRHRFTVKGLIPRWSWSRLPVKLRPTPRWLLWNVWPKVWNMR